MPQFIVSTLDLYHLRSEFKIQKGVKKMLGFKMMTGLVVGSMVGMVAAPFVLSVMHKNGINIMPQSKVNKFVKVFKKTAFRTFRDLREMINY